MRLSVLPVLLLLVISITSVQAMTIHQADVTHSNGRYYIYFDVLIDADKNTVAEYMDDPASWPKWSSVVEKVTTIDTGNSDIILNIELNSCLFIFCSTLIKTEKVTRVAPGHLVTLTTADNADFRYAREIWKATTSGEQTRLVYDAVMEPNIYVLPFLNNWIISSRIRKELKRSIEQLERIARTQTP